MSNSRRITATCCNLILTVSCEQLSLTQSRTRNVGGRADFIPTGPQPPHTQHAAARAQRSHGILTLQSGQTLTHSLGGRRELSQEEEEEKKNTYTLTPCSQEYGWLKFHLKIISRAPAGMYEPVQILCIEWKQTLAKVLQLHTRAHTSSSVCTVTLRATAGGNWRQVQSVGAVHHSVCSPARSAPPRRSGASPSVRRS